MFFDQQKVFDVDPPITLKYPLTVLSHPPDHESLSNPGKPPQRRHAVSADLMSDVLIEMRQIL